MPQFGRPDADTFLGNYEDQAGGTSDIFEAIDEVTASDADYIISVESPSSEVYVCALSSVDDPADNVAHQVGYRYARGLPGDGQLDLVVQLREGYTNEGSPGSLIAAWTHTALSTTAVTATQTLSSAQADSITLYSDLFLRFVFNEV